MHLSIYFSCLAFFDTNFNNLLAKSLNLPNFFKPFGPKEPLHHSNNSTLVLLHVLFRHGNRTAQSNELYPRDPYLNETYFPFGEGQLTNAGKVKEYAIGKALRERYGVFLGPYYYPEAVDATTTDYNRTKMSLELVLASLFLPKGVEVWKRDLSWQPVPFNYQKRSEDKVLIGVECPNYLKKYEAITKSEKYKNQANKYAEDFAYISKHTGLNISKFQQVYNLYFGLATEQEWGFKLPDWTKKIWPQKIREIAIKEYFVATQTTDLKKMASGYFVKKIINDTAEKIKNIDDENGKKIYLYSAHENNIAELLILLDVFGIPHIPTYGSYIVFEVHKINNVYGFKIYYENYSSDKLKLLKIPACDEFCLVSKFEQLLEEYIPSDDLCKS